MKVEITDYALDAVLSLCNYAKHEIYDCEHEIEKGRCVGHAKDIVEEQIEITRQQIAVLLDFVNRVREQKEKK